MNDPKTVVSKTAKANKKERVDIMKKLREKRDRQWKNTVYKEYINMRRGKSYIKGIMSLTVGTSAENSG